MKNILYILIVFVFVSACGNKNDANENFDAFYTKYENADGVVAFKIAPFLLRLMVETENPEIDKAIEKVETIRVLINNITINNLTSELKNNLPDERYDILMTINKETAKITVYICDDDEKKIEVIALAEEADSFGAMQIRGEFGREEIKSLIETIDIDEALKMKP